MCMTYSEYNIHPLCLSYPDIQGQEYADFKADIRANGQREDIWLWTDAYCKQWVIEGKNRLRACCDEKIEPRFRTFQGKEDDIAGFIASMNDHRRHELPAIRIKRAKERLSTTQGGIVTRVTIPTRQVAEEAGVSHMSVARYNAVEEQAIPAVQKAMNNGQVSINEASKIAELPKPLQKPALAEAMPILCQRCKRVGVTKNCQACEVARNEHARKNTQASDVIEESGVSHLRDAVAEGKIPAKVGATIAKLPEKAQEAAVKRILAGEKAASVAKKATEIQAGIESQNRKMKDAAGHEIPKHLHDTFGDNFLVDSIGLLREMLKTARSVSGRHLCYLDMERVKEGIESVVTEFESAKPHSVCQDCHGKGCKHCRKSGYYSRDQKLNRDRDRKLEVKAK